jgi:flagellar biosynthesis protein FlhB
MFSPLNSTLKDIGMENFDEPETGLSAGHEIETLIITEDIRSYIYESAKWSKFLSIVGFVLTFLMVIAALSMNSIMASISEIPAYSGLAKFGSAGLTLLYLILALLYFYPSFLMYKFATAAKQAVLYGDQANLSVAMNKLKSIFKFWGILTIILISFYLLMLLAGIMIGLSAAGIGS